MSKSEIELKEIQLLQYYVLFQCGIYFFSFVVRDLAVKGFADIPINWIGLVPAIIFLIIFIVLGMNKTRKNLTKSHLLRILILLAITTILTRFLSPEYSIDRTHFLPGSMNFGSLNFGFEQTFFLIIPVLFIAWQFSKRTTFLFCELITAVDISLSLLTTETGSPISLILLATIVFRGVIFGVMGFFINGMSAVQKTQQKELEQANVRLKKYALSTEQLAQTRERNRLARELHDTLAHTLSSVAVQLEAVKVLFEEDPVEAKRVLYRSLENTRSGLNETRRALKDLRTSEVENFGLSQSLKNLLINGSTRSGFAYTENLQDNLNLLPSEISHFIYRTIQEAVENTVKHANAKHVDLDVKLVDNSFYLRYVDDGQGFLPDALNDVRHYGLKGMRERIELLGGIFDIQSSPGQGTTITIETEFE